jgi:hypothetical protein
MELRKDPITRSWVIVGHRENTCATTGGCPFCPDKADSRKILLRLPLAGPSQVTVFPHPDPLFRVEGDPMRRADGIYDQMQPIGADEIVIETPEHNRKLEDLSDDQILLVMDAWRCRVEDLKRDTRFKYVSIYKNYGPLAGQEGAHAHSQISATTFMPRRLLYELRASREWYKEKERCVFCDIVKQEERQGKRIVDTQGEYVALCPYASRVPGQIEEIWLRFCAVSSGGFAKSPPLIILLCIPRPISFIPRAKLPRSIGSRLRMIITGTLKSCRSWKLEVSPTALKKSITTHSCRKRPPTAFASWTLSYEAQESWRNFFPPSLYSVFHWFSRAAFCSQASADAFRWSILGDR